jgi:hypothetical protein
MSGRGLYPGLKAEVSLASMKLINAGISAPAPLRLQARIATP